MSDLNKRSAAELSKLIATGQVSPVDLLHDCEAAIEADNDAVNAVVTTCFDTANQAAIQAEAQVRSGDDLGPLHGVPVLIKDLADTAGLRTTYGSKHFADHVPEHDALFVSKLKAAGAIVIGKTNTPEFGAGANTSNMVFGATGNPFYPSLTSGGSSGGSAVALACDMAPLASGSDLGGSLRIPASFCSVVGMRPSPGVVPSITNVSGFSPLWTDGPMARSVEDMALMLWAISGYDPRDPLSMPSSKFDFKAFQYPTDLADLRVGFSTDLGVALVDHDIRALFEARKSAISPLFGQVGDLHLDLSAATEVFNVLRAESLFAAYGDLVNAHGDEIGANVTNNVHAAKAFSLQQTAQANAAHTQIYRGFQALFDDIDVLICPATAVTPFAVEENHPREINGQALEGYFAWYAITWALSLVGCPIVTIPCGLDHKGMPFGIQLVGPRNSDLALTRMARALESALKALEIGRILPPKQKLTP